MTTTICANCGGPRPKHPSARPDEPLYCSITCYRAGTGLDNPDTGDGRTWDPHERRYTTDRSTTNEAPPTTVTPANRWGNSTSNPGESRRAASPTTSRRLVRFPSWQSARYSRCYSRLTA
jgi:hypothetical protein